jgi:hypothetical protein
MEATVDRMVELVVVAMALVAMGQVVEEVRS